MTREEIEAEYKHALATREPVMNLTMLIKDIVDDFESRTCENCKHSYSSSIVNPTHCSEVTFPYFNEVDAEWEDMSMEITKDFGCNKFERKE